jgi:hypothetical protein
MTATSRAAGVSGSAQRWGPLWGARPADWALSEDQQTPTYEGALRRVALESGQLVLDIGCGVGAFLRVVAKPGALVVIQVWGPHERNDLEAMKEIIRPFAPPRPADAPPEPDYSKPGVLENLATQAGLHPESAFGTSWAFEFPDQNTLRRALVAPMGIAVVVGPSREEEVKDAIALGLASHRSPEGSYRLHNQYHYLIARA